MSSLTTEKLQTDVSLDDLKHAVCSACRAFSVAVYAFVRVGRTWTTFCFLFCIQDSPAQPLPFPGTRFCPLAGLVLGQGAGEGGRGLHVLRLKGWGLRVYANPVGPRLAVPCSAVRCGAQVYPAHYKPVPL